MKFLVALIIMMIAEGCASVQSVSLTSIPAMRQNEVKAEASRLIILGLNFDNDFVDKMAAALKDQCEGGQVNGILTKDETFDYFLFFVYRRHVIATGYCTKKQEKTASYQKEESSFR